MFAFALKKATKFSASAIGLYEARGDYQLVVEHMESDGEGALKQAFEALKFKLNNEGLFDTANKRALPNVLIASRNNFIKRCSASRCIK